jgi:spore coat polysaccharide biosynthesis protein SpsF (cytidylyltransferase family)
MEIKTVLITQARTGSTRLPGKVLMEINQTPLLKIHLDRLKKSKKVDKIIVATTICEEDNIIEELATEWGYEVFRGSENDVLDRFYQAVKNAKPLWVVRVTSDCPLIDPVLIDKIIEVTQAENKDYGSNVIDETFPDGQDVEVFKFSALESAWQNAKKKSEREHVTPYIKNNSNLKGENIFSSISHKNNTDYSKIRITVDEPNDFELINKVITELGFNKSWLEYTEYIINNKLIEINDKIIRNEAYLKSLLKD